MSPRRCFAGPESLSTQSCKVDTGHNMAQPGGVEQTVAVLWHSRSGVWSDTYTLKGSSDASRHGTHLHTHTHTHTHICRFEFPFLIKSFSLLTLCSKHVNIWFIWSAHTHTHTGTNTFTTPHTVDWLAGHDCPGEIHAQCSVKWAYFGKL